MIGYKVIAFDFCGVLGNHVEAKRRAISNELGKRIPIEQAVNGSFKHLVGGRVYQDAMGQLFTTRYFLSWCELFEGAFEVLHQLVEEGNRIRIVSKVHGLTEDLLREWCANSALPVHEFVTRRADKTPYYIDAHAAVDDMPIHLLPLQANDTELILFRHHKYSEGTIPPKLPFKVARDWSQLGRILCDDHPEMAAA